MKIVALILTIFFCNHFSQAQMGISFHQSKLPFVGINYEIKQRFLPEFRVGTDNYFDETSLELTLSYIFKKDETINAYAGVGARVNLLEGLVLPVGMNIYPFTKKNFGFQMELATLPSEGVSLLRGSWGIRYRFSK